MVCHKCNKSKKKCVCIDDDIVNFVYRTKDFKIIELYSTEEQYNKPEYLDYIKTIAKVEIVMNLYREGKYLICMAKENLINKTMEPYGVCYSK